MLNKVNIQEKENKKLSNIMIREVWDYNFRQEIEHLSLRLEKYKYIAMDTEFPGVIFQPQDSSREQYYKAIKKNVDTLKLIQVGITICDEDGNYPPNVSTWQFNLKFDLTNDQHSQESITLLMNSGINFENLSHKGIPIDIFGEYLMVSGLLLNEEIHWVSFHGIYDFAYLLKVITGLNLPETEVYFFETLRMYFPHYYDIRHLVRYFDKFRGSLSKLGNELNIDRVGVQHQAGSDSIITSEIFFKLKTSYFSDDIIYGDKNVLYGIGGDEFDMLFNTPKCNNASYNSTYQSDFQSSYFPPLNYGYIPTRLSHNHTSHSSHIVQGSVQTGTKLNPMTIPQLNMNLPPYVPYQKTYGFVNGTNPDLIKHNYVIKKKEMN